MDVFAIASFVCICILQDSRTTMMPVEGSCAFYLFLCASLSLLFLRWFVEGETFGNWPYKVWALIAVWLVLCAILVHGVPGAVHPFHFKDLNAVCQHGQEVMSSVVASMPHAFGDCNDQNAKPPHPCSGSSPLYQKGSVKDDRFTEAIWFGGLNTMHFDSCSLVREVPSSASAGGSSQFHLSVGGQFDRIQLYIRSHNGPIIMDSPNHCCGRNITFNLKFVVDCVPDFSAKDSIKNIRMEKCELAPMLVEETSLGGSFIIDAMDLSSMVEKLVKQHIHSFISAAHLKWGGKPMSLQHMLNKLVLYNAPRRAGQC